MSTVYGPGDPADRAEMRVSDTYLVWDTEYPDDGSQEIEADSLGAAKVIVAAQGDEDDEPSRYDGCVLTPELAAKRERMEGYRP